MQGFAGLLGAGGGACISAHRRQFRRRVMPPVPSAAGRHRQQAQAILMNCWQEHHFGLSVTPHRRRAPWKAYLSSSLLRTMQTAGASREEAASIRLEISFTEAAPERVLSCTLLIPESTCLVHRGKPPSPPSRYSEEEAQWSEHSLSPTAAVLG